MDEIITKEDELISKSTEDNLTKIEVKRFNNDILVSFYEELVSTHENFFEYKNDKEVDNSLKLRRILSILSRIEKIEIIGKYYTNIFNTLLFDYLDNINYDKTSEIYKISKLGNGFKLKIERDTVLEMHKINATYKLVYGPKEFNILRCSLTESGNCCGSMTIFNFQRIHGIGFPFTKLFINMIYDIAISLKTPNLIALHVTNYQYNKKLIEKHGFESVYVFKNRNSSNDVNILTKPLPVDFQDEKIIIKY